ncbi:LptA/OstA family protein [Atribacter laminatus]|jgi:lipopolysaccharide export system protein LptA|uniref:Lipopolysaccharide export system protein LptA n=1 Tax=Atribacter laminatus TaxID=2847778 RepID=A0A7T1AJR1_ATRLM|nr:LptA/OstA family protein [Atribacter laminatus]QPM67196.1 Lipopolysaccharide export system protein LptA [Atribacter laminatus]
MRKINIWPVLVLIIFLFLLSREGITAAQSSSDVTLKTSSAEFDEKTGIIYAKGQSTIQWQGVTMICPYLEVDTVKQEAKSEGEIQVVWEDKTIFSQSLFFYGKEKKVVMTDIQGKGKDFSFQTKKMDFFLSPGKILLTGNPLLMINSFQIRPQQVDYSLNEKKWLASSVVIAKEGWSGQSKSATYQEGSNFIVLEGNATVEKDGNQLRGEKILIDVETGKVRVEGNVEINIMAIEGEETN